jgi:hypothetical protein
MKYGPIVLLTGMFLASTLCKDTPDAHYRNLEGYNMPSRTEMIEDARSEIAGNGITADQAQASGIFSRRAYRTVRPSTYAEDDQLKNQMMNFVFGRDRTGYGDKLKREYSKHSALLRKYNDGNDWENMEKELHKLDEIDKKIRENSGTDDPYSEDAWSMYLGLPMKHNTFGISDYAPSVSSGETKYYYKLPGEFEKILFESIKNYDFSEKHVSEFYMRDGTFGEGKSCARVLGKFKVDRGEDENGSYLSYYDIYDFSPNLPLVGKTPLDKFTGKPFEIYNRIYYDRETMEIVSQSN